MKQTIKLSTWVLYILAAIIVVLCFTRCNGYKLIATHTPKGKDTSLLIMRYNATFPHQDSIVYGVPELLNDSAEYWHNMALQLLSLKPLIRIETKYKDTCTTAVEVWKEGFNLGLDVGYDSGRSQCHNTHQTDIVYRDNPNLQQAINNANTRNTQLQTENDKLKTENDKLKGEAIDKDLWRSRFFKACGVIAILLLGMGAYFYIKK